MNWRDAQRLIAPAVGAGGRWAELGAGEGTFTRALAELLGAGGVVLAVDREPSAVRALTALARTSPAGATIEAIAADFTAPLALPPLDGVLLANALHFVPATEQGALLARLARMLVPGGRIVLVEYENRAPSRWVPYPVSLARFEALADEAGLTAPREVGRRRSRYGGTMYAAWSGNGG